MKLKFSSGLVALLAVSVFAAETPRPSFVGCPLEDQFLHPPAEARPWVYWFWNNANVTREGITADLEAMQRVGIGGVLIMDVAGRFPPPQGTAEFMNPEWQRLFQFTLEEAARLGLVITMNNGPGWTGSSGPWIPPDLAMQKFVWSSVPVTGPLNFSKVLPVPAVSKQDDGHGLLEASVKYQDFYKDIVLLAFPEASLSQNVERSKVMDLSSKLSSDGKLECEIPPGKWIIQRIGATTTGARTKPPVAGGNGLECDKLSREAVAVHFAGMMGRLIQTAGPLAGKSLVGTHIDSWEVGSQNWTPQLREEFQRRRGYDLLPWLPCLTDTVKETIGGKTKKRFRFDINGPEANRFRWDYAQTLSELLNENYVGRLAELAHEHGLKLSVEGYNLTFGDEATYPARADVPMTEFWTPDPQFGLEITKRKTPQVASVAHTTGKKIVGAEAFTSGKTEQWKMTPADIKALGDRMFSEGVNHFRVHRYAHQPYLDRAPGATMGVWGLHYERTQTWWEMSGAWHEYLTRCQFLLQQGLYVADILYLRPESPNQNYYTVTPSPPAGYRYDEISAEALLERATVKSGKIVLSDGMSYRILVLPPAKRMTPGLAKKISQLAGDGAVVVVTGARPESSPSLQGFPACDQRVGQLGRQIWGQLDGEKITEHVVGQGKVIWGQPLNKVLADLRTPPDFTSDVPLNWIHRRTAAEGIYFVANPGAKRVIAQCAFRATGHPEIWNPESGEANGIESKPSGNVTSLALSLGPADSVFVVFQKKASQLRPYRPASLRPVLDVAGTWAVDFPFRQGAGEHLRLTNLVSWSDSASEFVRHFSGTAEYRITFTLAPSEFPEKNTKQFLELSDVKAMARVSLNGKDCGVAWRSPFRVDVTQALRSGTNQLLVSVANLWPNRLIGDAGLPENERTTWSSWQPYKSDMPLLPSGLLGPVRLLTEDNNP